MRREAVRRREQEDLIEAGRVPGILRRTSKVIGSSTKGFLGRIMDFLGTILVGWMVTNLPVIIDAVQDLTGRIQQAAGVLKNWFEVMPLYSSNRPKPPQNQILSNFEKNPIFEPAPSHAKVAEDGGY